MKIRIFICLVFGGLWISCLPSKKITTYGGIGDDRSLFFYHKGQGDPLIILHGGPGLNHNYFLPYLDSLASTQHLIYYDQKACGQSEIPLDTNAMRLHAFVNDIDVVRKKFGLKQFHLMAHSWGALLAVQYAILYPQQLTSLILVSPTAVSSNDVREASRSINSRFDHSDQIRRTQIIESVAFKENRPEAMAELMRLSFKQNMAIKEMADSIRIYIPADFSKRNAALRYLFRDLASYDFYPQLSKIKAPTLLICGDQDVGLPFTEKIQALIPGARTSIIKNAGHFPFIEQQGQFNSEINKFIGSLRH